MGVVFRIRGRGRGRNRIRMNSFTDSENEYDHEYDGTLWDTRETIRMFDCHVHTRLSYCADPALSPRFYADLLAARPELGGVAVTDHGMAVYFPANIAWSWSFLLDSRIFDEWRDRGNEQLRRHLNDIAQFASAGVVPGLEVEMMHDGRLTVDPAFRPELDVLVGSVHSLPALADKPPETILQEWKAHVRQLLESGIDVLGHPFRWLDGKAPISLALIREMVAVAGRNGVAVEVNGHYHIAADAAMLRAAAELAVPVAFATDSHRPDEPGDFRYHHALLDELGLTLADLRLFAPRVGR
jgi:histidinol phosphatase-like PHP family hydrolase